MPVIRLEDRKLTFPVDGVHVDMNKSNNHDVFLRNINKQSAGQYKCQVSVENTFKSISVVKKMDVRDRLPTQDLNANNNNNNNLAAAGGSNSMAGLGIVSNGNYNSNNNLFNNRQQQQRHAILRQQLNNKSMLMNHMSPMPSQQQQQQQHKQQASSSSSKLKNYTAIIFSVLQLITMLLIYHE